MERVASLWKTEGDRAHCLLCPHSCRIPEGGVGVCGVRGNRGGRLMALTYGRISSIAVDPIEKKPVFHYFPGTNVLSLGSVGCSMRCGHCQNWQISRQDAGDGADLHDLPPAQVVDMARKYRCPGVAFTYNEPSIWIEYVRDVARLCRDAGLYTVMVTNGYITEAGLDLIGELIDVWRVDVKALDDETYRRLCRVRSGRPIFDMAERARRHWRMHVEVVTNVIPTVNDSDETVRGIARWIADGLGEDTPWHITRFFPYLEMAHLPPTPVETLRRAREIGGEEGLRFVYLGNIGEPGSEDTTCPQCRAVAVSRNGFEVTRSRTEGGACLRCGEALNIVE